MTLTWTIEKPDVSIERQIVTGMIVFDRALRALALTYRNFIGYEIIP